MSLLSYTQHKDTATSLEFAYAVMLDVLCIISNESHDLTSGSHECCLVSHALSDLHHMIQRSCTKVKGESQQKTRRMIYNVVAFRCVEQ